MNPPLVTFELKEHYLLVIGHGRRDSLSSMAEAAAMIYEKVRQTNSYYVLVDYRYLEIHVPLTDAFNIVRRYEAVQPEFRKAVIAAVFGENGKEFGNLWKDIARKRGFTIEAFEDIAQAEKWLLTRQQ